jgi:hypothetical protein
MFIGLSQVGSCRVLMLKVLFHERFGKSRSDYPSSGLLRLLRSTAVYQNVRIVTGLKELLCFELLRRH